MYCLTKNQDIDLSKVHCAVVGHVLMNYWFVGYQHPDHGLLLVKKVVVGYQ